MSDPKTIDKLSREKIISDLDHNFFVEAGAGSGKTTVLVERMVAMVEAGKDISKISAITFTKAAANEFYSRFQKRLVERSNIKSETEFKQRPGRIPYPSSPKTREKCQKALQNIDLAFMGTIDSFCNMVMSEHPMEGHIPSSSFVVENEDYDELIKNEYIEILNGNYLDPQLSLKANEFLRVIGDYYDSKVFIATMKVLLDHRDVDIVIPNTQIVNIDIRFEDEIKSIRKIFEVLRKHENYISANATNTVTLNKAIKQYNYVINNDWDDNIPGVLLALDKTLLNKHFRLSIDPEVREALGYTSDYFKEHEGKSKYLEIDENKLPKLVEEIKNIQYKVVLEFCLAARPKLLTRLRNAGKLSFNDYLIYLRDTLKEDIQNGGKLIKHIYDRHSYFLIDEFQDTDPIQAEIFFYLAAKKPSVDWKKCIPYPGSLFIVGDPKQSIYRFKNADVASYLSVEEMFKDNKVGEVLNLYCNFRSTNLVKTYFNNVFKDMLKEDNETKEQAGFVDIPVESTNDTNTTKVYKYGVPYKAKSEDEKDQYQVANVILKLINNDDYQIFDKDLEKNRKLDFKDFMLITPAKGTLSKYTKVFREYKIPYFIEGKIVFSESKALKELTTIYGAITQPLDNRYLYGALKTSVFHIKEKDIIEARNNGYIFNVLNYNDDLKLSNELKSALSKLYELSDESKKINPSSLFLKLIEELEVFKYTGDKNLEYVYFVLELLKNKESTNEIISHLEALNYLEGLLSEDISEERCPGLEKSGNQVHIANLHKVKGLEAPVVILGSPKHASHKPSFRSDRNNHKGYLFSVKNYDINKNYIETTCFNDEQEKEVTSEGLEKLRLLYVAATRAKNILFISSIDLASGEISKEDNWAELRIKEDLTFNDFNELLTVKVNTIVNNELDYKNIKINKSNLIINSTKLSDKTYVSLRPSSLVKDNEIIDSELSDVVIKEFDDSSKDTLSTIKGTLVHRLMELIINSKDLIKPSNLINQIINELLKDEFIEYKEELTNMLNNVYNTLHNGGYKQTNGAEDNILPILLSADEVYSEVPFTYKEDSNIYNGIIDLVYRKDNKYHIIDWKTNKSDKDLDKHYKAQLDIYKKAFESSIGLKVEDAKIYHIGILEV